MTGHSLRAFLEAVVTAATLEDERLIVADELANMRTLVKDSPDGVHPRVIAKLVFLDTLGFDIAWGQMEIVNLMSRTRLSHKRIGYLAASSQFNETNERIVLITATVHKDLSNPSPIVQRLALSLVANVASPEMGQAVAATVIKLSASPDPIVQKLTGIAAVRIVRVCPDIADQFRSIVPVLVNHSTHSVVAAGILLAREMIVADPIFKDTWAPLVSPFTKVLKTLFDSKPNAEFQFGLVYDHFLQVRIL
jgi:AP-3 complex subunit delta-1